MTEADTYWVYALFYRDTPGAMRSWTYDRSKRVTGFKQPARAKKEWVFEWTVPADGIVWFYAGQTGFKKVHWRTRQHYLNARYMIEGNPKRDKQQMLYHFIADVIKSTDFEVKVLQTKDDDTQCPEAWWVANFKDLGMPMMNTENGTAKKQATKYASRNREWKRLNKRNLKERMPNLHHIKVIP